ncbi:MAG: DNA polymerase III subunit delta [Sporichthyaceae bacterium]
MSTLPPLSLVYGPEDLLADRAVAGAVRMIRAVEADADVHQVVAGELSAGDLSALTAPSLFAVQKLIVIRAAQDLSGPVLAEVEGLVASPPEDTCLVLVHPGSAKGKALVDKVRKAGATVVDCAEVKRAGDKIAFVNAEFRAAGRRVSGDAARALLDAVGGSLRELAAACAQLAADTTGTIEVATIRRYYAGRAEVSSFAVAELAVEGRTGEALAHLRWSLAAGVEPVLLTAALAMGLRGIAKLGAPGDTTPDWKLKRLREQARGWDMDGLARALTAVAVADLAVKGGALSPGYALERAIVEVAASRR